MVRAHPTVPLFNDLADHPQLLALFWLFSVWSRPGEKNSMTGEELNERNIAAMGEEASTQYSPLNEVAITAQPAIS